VGVDVTPQLQDEVEKVLVNWDRDRRSLPMDWQGRIADTTLQMCINEMRAAVLRATAPGSAMPVPVPVLEDVG
jgi:hypothetical protein